MALGVMIVLASTGVVRADGDIALQRGDSIQIGHDHISCAPDRPRRRDIVMASGDSLTVHGRHITCDRGDVGDDDDQPAPAPAMPRVQVTSRVELGCVDSLYRKVTGNLTPSGALGFAYGCRAVKFPASCTVTSTADDDACYDSLYRKVSGSFDPATALRVHEACKAVTASCEAPGPARTSSRVDGDCYDRLYRSTAGNPSPRTALQWLRSCRTTHVERCTVVSAAFDESCVDRVYRSITGNLTPAQASEVAHACRAIEASCP